MPSPPRPTPDERALEIAHGALTRPRAPFQTLPSRLVVVDVPQQRLALIEAGRVALPFTISTAAAGVGGADGSLRTPPGWHRIEARIGGGAEPGTVFRSRVATGEIWRPGTTDALGDEDLILTRILTLAGLEPTVNQGPGCDSLERYIYIHGTNHPESLGRPTSHGCVRMANEDIMRLFDRVEVGDPVVIVGADSMHAA